MGSEQDKIQRLICQMEDLQREVTGDRQSKSMLRHRISELKLQLNKYRSLLEHMPQYVSFKNREGTYISCNRSYASFLRISSEDITGKNDYDFFPGELADRHKENEEKVVKSGVILEFEETYNQEKNEKILRVMKVPVRDEEEKQIGVLTISWDITRHKQAELAVQKARGFAESIVNTIREPLLVLDDVHRIILASRSFYNTFDTAPEDIEGKSIFEIENRQWDIPRLRELLGSISPETSSFENFEVEHDFPTLGHRVMLLNARLIYREEHHSAMILLAFEDITKRIEAEKKLDKLREELLATLTHDMKGPLSSMVGWLQLLEKPQFGSISEKKLEFLKMFRSSIDTLLSMVNNIVHTSIIDADRMNYALEDFTLSVLLRELNLTFEATAMLSGITLDFNCPQDICVHADREKIHMVFYNLLSNAFRYTPYGGSIAIKALPEDDTVTIIVSDTGQGIAESEYDKIFQKFSRVRGELRGTGMGLYIVRNILKGHGSDIRFESAMGKGTKFIFSLAQGTPPGNDAPPL